jgi:ADP-ribose pyrophosphatase YjhB (NUDIX family)/GNAT superfamily N-acetyltransferase
MPIPDFVRALRGRVGSDLLWLPGVSAVVRNAQGEVLLARRADNGRWSLLSGILEPGEQPAVGLAREIEEETGVVAEIEALALVWTLPAVTYPNGDRAQYLDLCFLARHVAGEARVNDDESLEVGWFSPEALPEMPERSRVRIERALAYDGSVWFEGAPQSGPVDGDGPVVPLAAPGPVSLRRARREDVPAIVALLADDPLGGSREHRGDLTTYLAAFERIDADPAHLLVVVHDGDVVVGTLQLTVLPSLSRGGALRAQVEAVRVGPAHRGRGLGQALLLWAVEEARARGCSVVQLTTDKQRTAAHRFYERLGFVASHEGMKLQLEAP